MLQDWEGEELLTVERIREVDRLALPVDLGDVLELEPPALLVDRDQLLDPVDLGQDAPELGDLEAVVLADHLVFEVLDVGLEAIGLVADALGAPLAVKLKQGPRALPQVEAVPDPVQGVVIPVTTDADHFHDRVVGLLRLGVFVAAGSSARRLLGLLARGGVDDDVDVHAAGVTTGPILHPLLAKPLSLVGGRVEQHLGPEGVRTLRLALLGQVLRALEDAVLVVELLGPVEGAGMEADVDHVALDHFGVGIEQRVPRAGVPLPAALGAQVVAELPHLGGLGDLVRRRDRFLGHHVVVVEDEEVLAGRLAVHEAPGLDRGLTRVGLALDHDAVRLRPHRRLVLRLRPQDVGEQGDELLVRLELLLDHVEKVRRDGLGVAEDANRDLAAQVLRARVLAVRPQHVLDGQPEADQRGLVVLAGPEIEVAVRAVAHVPASVEQPGVSNIVSFEAVNEQEK